MLSYVTRGGGRGGIVAYKIDIQEQGDYLRATVSGERVEGQELDDAVGVWLQLAGLCHQKGHSRVLALVDLTGEIPPMVAYKLAESPDRFGWSRTFKAAVVDINEVSRNSNRFTETVAVNRGYQVKIFSCEQEAIGWLLGSD